MFGVGKLKLESHKHKYFRKQMPGVWNGYNDYKIDEAVGLLWDNQNDVMKMRRELDAIHAAWTKQKCGPCAHKPVCEKSLKYGDECENRMVIDVEVQV